MVTGFATPAGTARYASRFPALEGARWFRQFDGLTVSNLGLGTYLGHVDDEADALYRAAVEMAIESGINFIDTARNYRHGHSEIAVGQGLAKCRNRDEVVVATKAGYAGSTHSLDPDFLEAQLDLSRAALGLETVDIFYLHNPETQLRMVDGATFDLMMEKAFERCEAMVESGKIRSYGTATWDGYRVPGQLDLKKIVGLAGPRFRWIQLPLNAVLNEGVGLIEEANGMGLGVATSATIYQGRLKDHLPVAIQFARFTSGVHSALIGMGRPKHVADNIAAAISKMS